MSVHSPLPAFGSWAGPRKPKVLFIGEAWGREEEMLRAPFVGMAGRELFEMLGQAWSLAAPAEHLRVSAFLRYEAAWVKHRGAWMEECGIAFTNVLNLRPPDNKLEALCASKMEVGKSYHWPAIAHGKYLLSEFLPEVERLAEEIREARPNLVVCLGNTAAWAVLGYTNVTAIRGTVQGASGDAAAPSGQKCLVTYHPAALFRQWSWRPIVVADLIKAGREADSPVISRPAREVLVNPLLEELRPAAARVRSDAIATGKPISADIETAKGQITCISFAGSPDFALVVPFVDEKHSSRSYWPSVGDEIYAWEIVRELLIEPKAAKLGQNFLYDIQYITQGPRIAPTRLTEDTMLLHHALYPEMKKGLGFLGSIYTSEPAWKLMRRKRADTDKRDE